MDIERLRNFRKDTVFTKNNILFMSAIFENKGEKKYLGTGSLF